MSTVIVPNALPAQIAVFRETQKYGLYGETGSGKTKQAGHLIRAFGKENVGLVSCEDGLSTIETQVTTDMVFAADSLTDMDKAKAWAKARFVGGDKWVFIDGATRMLKWIETREMSGADRMYEAVLGGVKPFQLPSDIRPFARYLTKDGAIDVMAIWKRIGRDATIELDDWRKMPCNVVFTFWEEETYRSAYEKGAPWKPEAPGKAATDAVINTVDWLFRLKRVGGGTPTAYTDPTSAEYRAKHRLDTEKGIDIPPAIKDFNLATFHQRIKGQG